MLAFGSDSSGTKQSFWIKDNGVCKIVSTVSRGMYANGAPWFKQTCKAEDILEKIPLANREFFYQCILSANGTQKNQ
jgi:hypothetical protein